jgi:hypothetical protein
MDGGMYDEARLRIGVHSMVWRLLSTIRQKGFVGDNALSLFFSAASTLVPSHCRLHGHAVGSMDADRPKITPGRIGGGDPQQRRTDYEFVLSLNS